MTSPGQTDFLQRFFLGLPLRKTLLATSGIAILLLVGVSFLGIRQYLLYRHCEQVVTSSKHLLFQFSAIKEHINEALITRKILPFKELSAEIEALGTDIDRIMNDVLIPDNFKQAFITRVDLVGLVVKLRTIQEGADAPSTDQLGTLSSQLRSIDSRITLFHQGLSSYTQGLLLGLHKTLAGCLALILSVLSALLFWINRFLSHPIHLLGLEIDAMTRNKSGTKQGVQGNGIPDVSIHAIVEAVTTLSSEHRRLSRLFNAMTLFDDFLRKSPASATLTTERWHDLCSILQTNGEYCLVWAGILTEDEEHPQPISACGCLATTEEGCLEILDHLLKYCKKDGGLCDSVNRARQTMTSVISRQPTASLPESLQNLLPFVDETFTSASFPVPSGEQIVAFVTLYSSGRTCFQPAETTLLSYFFNHLVPGRLPAPPDQESGRMPATDRRSLEALSRIYRYAAIGNLTTGLAHELSNLSNGTINYTQALLDLTEDQGQTMEPGSPSGGQKSEQAEESQILLTNLLTEEKKIARLVVELQQLARDTGDELRPFSLQEIIQPIETIIKGQAKAEGIDLQINIAPALPPIPKNGPDIQMVLLFLIQSARLRTLEKYPAGRHERKKILVSAMADQHSPQCRIVVSIQDFGTPWKSTPSDTTTGDLVYEPWLDLNQCRLLLQNAGGELAIDSLPDRHTICTCVVPC